MRITELLKQESIGLNVSVSTKEEAIDKLVDLMAAGGRLKDKAGYKEGILAREALGSTGIGGGIAIPHAKVEAVKEPGLAAMVVPAGVDYEAFDASLANILFMIAAPAEGADVHLEALSRLSTLLMNPDFMEELLKALRKRKKAKKKRKLPVIVFWQSPPVRPALPTPIWLQRAWKIWQRSLEYPLR